MTEPVRVYQDITNLNTEERKALYREILEEDCFGERSKRFTRASKTLMFKGEIESYGKRSIDPTSLWRGFAFYSGVVGWQFQGSSAS
ncbi:hypothetical protein SAMN05421553_3459 [Pseudomonas anguilliseptica]|uniref:Uncharacterized protein n=1 Tax=Pseudomonas anguilliseptica TaxID=53406 RepID=A0A1H5DZG8_PSEAG|nr:hypothetical protein SAMN05421553_3459 [Pseudomonas anguilliseptica]